MAATSSFGRTAAGEPAAGDGRCLRRRRRSRRHCCCYCYCCCCCYYCRCCCDRVSRRSDGIRRERRAATREAISSLPGRSPATGKTLANPLAAVRVLRRRPRVRCGRGVQRQRRTCQDGTAGGRRQRRRESRPSTGLRGGCCGGSGNALSHDYMAIAGTIRSVSLARSPPLLTLNIMSVLEPEPMHTVYTLPPVVLAWSTWVYTIYVYI